MKDGIIAETGNSRLIRANLPATYEELREMAAAGTLPMDILFNAAGWSQLPDFLGKATLLKDATAEALGGDSTMVPDEALAALKALVDGNAEDIANGLKIELVSYAGTGGSKSITFSIAPVVWIFCAYHNDESGAFVASDLCHAYAWGNHSGSGLNISGYVTYFDYSGNTVTLRNTDYFNASGCTYYALAIGY